MKMNYRVISLIKKVKDLFTKKFKMLKKIERLPMLMDYQDKCKNGHHIKVNLQIHCTAHQTPNVIFHRNSKNNIKFHTETKMAWD